MTCFRSLRNISIWFVNVCRVKYVLAGEMQRYAYDQRCRECTKRNEIRAACSIAIVQTHRDDRRCEDRRAEGAMEWRMRKARARSRQEHQGSCATLTTMPHRVQTQHEKRVERTLLATGCPYEPRTFEIGASWVIGAGIGAATGPCRSRLRLLSRFAVGVGAKLPIGGNREVSARGVC
jgi:hypothetical protein